MSGLLFDLSDLLSLQFHPWTIKLASVSSSFDWAPCCLLLQTFNFVITFLDDALQVKPMPTNVLPQNLASVHDSEYVFFSNCGDRTCSWLHERVRKRPIVRGEGQGATARRLPSQGRRLPVTNGFQLPGTYMPLSRTPGSDFLCRSSRVQAPASEE
jgi:hypothetical protein